MLVFSYLTSDFFNPFSTENYLEGLFKNTDETGLIPDK